MPRYRLPTVLSAILVSALAIFASPAHAQQTTAQPPPAQDNDDGADFTDVMIAADLEYALPIDSFGDSGGGFGIRTGLQLHVPAIIITPEIGFMHDRMGGDGAPVVTRGILGARLGIGEIFRFGAAGHIGIASLDAELDDRTASRSGFCYDLGIFFDFTLLPLFDLGVHGVYNQLTAGDAVDAFHFLTFGVHAALII